jgi:hypothetical protein
MKKLVMAIAVAVALVNTASAQVGPTPFTRVPEPSSFLVLAVNLLVLGGLALIVRKRFSNNEVE